MADNLVLYNRAGASAVNIGSWLQADPGPDYGARGLIQAIETEGFADGGRLAYERAGIRKMSFPLMLASGGAALSLANLEALIRDNARPGGYLDVQADGTPSADAIRFDIIHGAWEPAYSVYLQRAARRQGQLLLDVQPYGYMPTVILLASGVSASYQDTFQLTWNPGSILGDAPALAVVAFHASVATYMTLAPTLGGAGNTGQFWRPDGYWWSLARPSGATGFSVPADFTAATTVNQNTAIGSNNIFQATIAPLNTTPFGAYMRLDLMPSGIDAWKQIVLRQMPASAAQLYAGRYRVYGFFRYIQSVASPGLSNAQATQPLQILLDEAPGSYLTGVAPMASAYPVATLISVAPTGLSGVGTPWPDAMRFGNGGLGGATEPGFNLVDLGEHSFPPQASGAWAPWQLRLWARMGTSFVGTYPRVDFAGLRFQALDGPAGILTSGAQQPTTNNIVGTDGAGNFWGAVLQTDSLLVDGINHRVAIFGGSALGAGSNIASPGEIVAEPRSRYLGEWPRLVGTEMQFDMGVIDRPQTSAGATTMTGAVSRSAIAVSVGYRPQFQFLKGL